jgi:uncharacterized protein YeaO (DUF488 family)
MTYETTLLIPDPDPTDVGWYEDASTSYGIGILIGRRWTHFALKERFKPDAPIAWLKTIAVQIGLVMLNELGISKGKQYIVQTDNTTTYNVLLQQKLRDRGVNEEWKTIQKDLLTEQINLHPLYVKSKDNKADGLFRGEQQGHWEEDRFQITLPQDLATFFVQSNQGRAEMPPVA